MPAKIAVGFCGEGACSRWAAKRPQKPINSVYQVKRDCRIYDCFAAEREQAPSPQKPLPKATQVSA